MRHILQTCTGLLAALFLLTGCKDPIADHREENTLDAVWGMTYLTGYLLNGYIATRPTGSHDVTVQCSGVGSIRITGWTDYDSQSSILSMDLTYEFAGTYASVVATNLSVSFHPLVGAIRQTGVIRSEGEPYEDTVTYSTALAYDVTVDRLAMGTLALSNSGSYEVHAWTTTGGPSQFSRNATGQLASVSFSWSYPVSSSNSSTASTNAYGIHVDL